MKTILRLTRLLVLAVLFAAPSAAAVTWNVGTGTGAGLNALTSTGTIGGATGSNFPVEIWVNGARGMRVLPATIPNIVGGGTLNTIAANAYGASILGGNSNKVADNYGAVCGGGGNLAGSDDGIVTNAIAAAVLGGSNNRAVGANAVVVGGDSGQALGSDSAVLGGFNGYAPGNYSATLGGYYASSYAPYSIAGGYYAAVSFGGDYSVALGSQTDSQYHGCMVFGDSNYSTKLAACSAANQFVARSSGGVYFYTNSAMTTGAMLTAGSGAWASVSDRNLKEKFQPVDTDAVLAKVAAMPITRWSYKSEAGVTHMGPVAQDFRAAFGLGTDDKSIVSVDADGVALAAIQGLNRKIAKLEADNLAMQARLDRLEPPKRNLLLGLLSVLGVAGFGMVLVRTRTRS